MSLATTIPEQIKHAALVFAEGRYAEAIERIDPLVDLMPDQPALHNLAGAAYAGAGRLDEAVTRYDRAISLQPDFADAHSNRGAALREKGRLVEALDSFDLAIACRPDFAEAHSNRGIVLKALGRSEEALLSYDRAILLNPRSSSALYNRGNALHDVRRLDDALASFDQAIAQRPDYAEAHCNRGNTLHALGRLDAAVESFDRAIRFRPGFATAYANRGNALHEMKRLDAALQSYEEAVRLDPGNAETLGRLLFLRAHMCEWPSAHDAIDIAALGVDTDAVTPFNMLALDDDARRSLRRSTRWAKAKYPPRAPACARPLDGSTRIRLGYFSADFHVHATMWLIAKLLEAHDKSRFEIHAFSFGPDRRDAMRQRAVDAVDVFHDVRGLSDAAVAELARGQGIDIAVDLKGYTQDARPAIFAYGAAPVQIAYLGYPGSSGADFIDYIIADPVVVPSSKRSCYSEKQICLPHSYQVNDDGRPIAESVPDREAFGLPRDGFVFCCFNNSFKISPREFDVWMRLLTQVEGSVLWLLRDNRWAEANLCREAERRGVADGRLIFADRAALPDHLARHRHADLFLDTFACNAHTTASDALWAGLPLLTLLGDAFAARVAGSLLHAVGLPELAVDRVEDYEQLALALARDPQRLAAIRAKLAGQRLAHHCSIRAASRAILSAATNSLSRVIAMAWLAIISRCPTPRDQCGRAGWPPAASA